MQSGAETVAAVIAAVDHDPRLPTQRARCRVFHALVGWGRGLTRDTYPSAGREGCAAYPYGTWPDGT